jgi:hypothetical protein
VTLTPTTTLPPGLAELAERTMVCEYASLTRDGRPVTWPLTPYVGAGGTLDVSTGLTYPGKAERARRDPRVALLFSSPVGTGLAEPPVVLVQGLASVRDADLQATTDRYVRDVQRKTPTAYDGVPEFVLRRLDWYFARIYIELTPLRVLTWPGGRLDAEPERWTAPEGTTAPPSDPAPRGRALPPREQPPTDWRPFADRADRLERPVLTVTGDDGWPLPLRCRSAVRTTDGYLLEPPAGVPVTAGPACLTAHTHTDVMDAQENVVLLGSVEPADDGRVHLRVERALADWSITGSKFGRMAGFVTKGRKLRPRLRLEAERRGQPVPEIRL